MTATPKNYLVALVCLLCCVQWATAQQPVDSLKQFPGKAITRINERAEAYNKKLDRQTEKYLRRLEKQELKLQRKLAKVDSSRAAQLFSGTKEKYRALREKLKQKTNGQLKGVYVPNLDSMGLSLDFLSQYGLGKNLKEGKELATKASEQFKELKDRLRGAEDIRQYIKDRKQLLKQALDEQGLGKHLKKFSKEGYYYAKQVQEYKEAWKDPAKMEQKLLALLNKIPAFKKFAESNSQLAGLFGLPTGYSNNAQQSIAGLQTRAGVNALVRTQIAAAGPNAMQAVQQNMQQAQAQLNQLRTRLNRLGGQNSSDFDLPGFTPNTQRTKSFWQRLQLNTDLQTNRGAGRLPNIADVAAGLSFKIDDKKQIGTQLVYKAGLGTGLNNIKLTHQGFGYRFYGDLKFKKGFWFTGGYEQNYMAGFRNITELRSGSYWQSSALAGLSKKYKLKNKGGEMKLLYDFLWNKKVGGQRFVWRTGFTF